ncbi:MULTISPECIES: rRNA maturation RNase YbeY [Thermodesulfovibrio]|uniref:rRNA maturation RNase YbeY n=1 Tax=Thermodesulfovibrio TaxID=28261 RepID=UPI00262EA467|nr:rRNA maturation RNase YbeY [Thermodesulfovibrio sp.]
MKIEIELTNRQRKIKISKRRLTTTAKKIIQLLGNTTITERNKAILSKKIIVSVVLIGGKRMREINYRYRGKKYITDVLSFPYLENHFLMEEVYLGELLICPEKALLQSKQYGATFWEEMQRLLVHGILHLLGYDHEGSKSQAREMFKIEKNILKNLQT